MPRLSFSLFTLIVFLLLAGCARKASTQPPATKSLEGYRLKVAEPTLSALTEAAQTEAALSIPPADCPVTTPGKITFKAPEPYAPEAPWEDLFWYGSEDLWTALKTDGVWSGLPDNPEGYTQKIMWWSDSFVLANEEQPNLLVSGQRLDASAPPLKVYRATNAMADDIGEAMLTGVDFPTRGCWQVTGQYKKAELTFVVWIAP